MTTFENTNTQINELNVSQMISEAAYKLVVLVERMFTAR